MAHENGHDMGGLRGEMAGLRAEMAGMRTDMAGMRTDMAGMRTDMAGMRTDMADLKVTMVAGFAGMFTRQQGDEMLRLLREGNRRSDERFTQLDVRMREQHLETQQALRALIDGQRQLTAEVRRFVDGFLGGRGNAEPT